MNEFVHGDNLVVINVQLNEVGIEVFLSGLYSFQFKVALNQSFELLPVNFPVVLAVRTVEYLF